MAATSTLVTASVWGQGRAALKLTQRKGVSEGEEECHICRDGPASVSFKPCAHKVCFACVENMRAKNIFRQDKGVKCPFCRAFVDEYAAVHNGDEAVEVFLREANKAATIAAAARRQNAHPSGAASSSAGPSHAVSEAAAPHPTGRSDERWHCAHCSTSNLLFRETCSRCSKACTLTNAQRHAPTKTDLLKVSREELVGYCQEKGHPYLNRAFLEVGMPCKDLRLSGSNAAILEAVSARGQERLLRVVHLLADEGSMKALAMHNLGNYAVQRLLECTSRLRDALGNAGRFSLLDSWRQAHSGRDPFGALLQAVCANMPDVLCHDQGSYVVQCAITCAAPSEVVEVAGIIAPHVPGLATHPKAIFAIKHLAETLRDRVAVRGGRLEAQGQEAADALCQLFVGPNRLYHAATRGINGAMLVAAIEAGLPRFAALRCASGIAACAGQAAFFPSGRQTLIGLLRMRRTDPERTIILREVACNMCFSLQGEVGRLMIEDSGEFNPSSPIDTSPATFLKQLMDVLAEQQEVAWLDSILQELVGVADELHQSTPAGIELLKHGLSLNVMDITAVEEHVQQLMALLGSQAMAPIVADIMEVISEHPDPEPPKYPFPSVMHWELRHHIDTGRSPPPAPPPPPRPGEDDATAAAPLADGHSRQGSGQLGGASSSGRSSADSAARPAGQQPAPGGVPVPTPSAAAGPLLVPVPTPSVPVPVPVPLPGVAVPTPSAPGLPVPVPIPVPTPSAVSQPASSQPPAAAQAPAPTHLPHPSQLYTRSHQSNAHPLQPQAPSTQQQQQQQSMPHHPGYPSPQMAFTGSPHPAPHRQAPAPVYGHYTPVDGRMLRPGAAYAAAHNSYPGMALQAQMYAPVQAMGVAPYGYVQAQPMQAYPPQWQQQQLLQHQHMQQQYMQQQHMQQQVPQHMYQQPRPRLPTQPQPPAHQPPSLSQPVLQAAQQQMQPPQQPRQAPAPPGRSPAGAVEAWSCSVCTFEHVGEMAEYLACSMCGSERGD